MVGFLFVSTGKREAIYVHVGCLCQIGAHSECLQDLRSESSLEVRLAAGALWFVLVVKDDKWDWGFILRDVLWSSSSDSGMGSRWSWDQYQCGAERWRAGISMTFNTELICFYYWLCFVFSIFFFVLPQTFLFSLFTSLFVSIFHPLSIPPSLLYLCVSDWQAWG